MIPPVMLPDKLLIRAYYSTGHKVWKDTCAGGEQDDFEEHVFDWHNFEKECARRGFLTLSLDRFNKPSRIFGQKRSDIEEPSFYSKRFYHQVFVIDRPKPEPPVIDDYILIE